MIKNLLALVILGMGLNASAGSPSLRVGDILLQPLYCWSCALIEAEENSIYSHMGIVVQVAPEVLVAESWQSVTLTPLEVFKKRTEKNQAILVRRYQNEAITLDFEKDEAKLSELLKKEFLGLKYDPDFLWHNFDNDGNEQLYCSEFVSKLLQAFLGIEGPIKRMVFKVNTDQWIRYFQGRPLPIGQWGNCPGDYEKTELLYSVGEL
jgi:hypothetical protein